MTFPVLPLIEAVKEEEISRLSVVGLILLPYKVVKPIISKHFLKNFPSSVQVNVDIRDEKVDIDEIINLLNVGVEKLVVLESQMSNVLLAKLPTSRFIYAVENSTIVDGNSGLLFRKPTDVDQVKSLVESGRLVYLESNDLEQHELEKLVGQGYILVIKSTELSTESKSLDKISISLLFTSSLTTDRPDGLFTTLVMSEEGTALGVVYSSVESIQAAIKEKVGVYQSRKRPGLWYKGKTSGATQELVKLEKDCDNDVVNFIVKTKPGYGFCHLQNNFTCFGDNQLNETNESGTGLTKLNKTLKDRFDNAPDGSYTKRLFDDEKLLIAKMKEELDELIEAGQANDKSEISWEAADLIYFVMVWCIKNGVDLKDIEKNLDIKSMKVTRRKGDAKEKYINKENQATKVDESIANVSNPYAMEVIDYNSPSTSPATIQKALTRPVQKTSDIMKLVLPIIENVKSNGDKALIELTEKFDGVKLQTPILNAPFPEELMEISQDMREAIDISIRNIEKFHTAQLPKEEVMTVETCPGVNCSRFAKPIENVGLYVPGGTAVLPSTAMMLGVPAKVAGCANIILASPPSKTTGKLTPEVVYVAHKIGAKCIVMAGGAQAVAAMAYGTETVMKCDKILGPGNQFVTAAKMHIQNDTQALCSIDMPAGPSEVLVIADENSDADFVASDLLSQAEHGVDSQVILVGVNLSKKKIAEFEEAVSRQADVLPRKEIVAKCLSHSFILLTNSYDQAFDLSNKYAPEHLILQIDNAKSYVPSKIENAGSVFVGALSPESCGDYSSGTNHTLPTYGYARQYSGVNTATFQKFITAQDVSKEGLKHIGKAVMTLAAVEGLEAHRYAVQVRMDKLGLV